MTLTFPALPFAALFRWTASGPSPRPQPPCDDDPMRSGRASALEMMDRCPEALASEMDFHCMMYLYPGRS